MTDRLMWIDDLADYLGVPVDTIRYWRKQGTGPRGIRVGKHLRFRLGDVERWLDSQPDGHRLVEAGRRPTRAK